MDTFYFSQRCFRQKDNQLFDSIVTSELSHLCETCSSCFVTTFHLSSVAIHIVILYNFKCVCVCVCVCVSAGRGDLQPQLDSAMQDVSDKYLLLEETEKQAVRKALVEERSRFCYFVSMLRPVVVSHTSTHPNRKRKKKTAAL